MNTGPREYVVLRQAAVLDLIAAASRRANTTVGVYIRREIGISRAYLYALASGNRSCSRTLGRRIADALDVSLSTIADELPAQDVA